MKKVFKIIGYVLLILVVLLGAKIPLTNVMAAAHLEGLGLKEDLFLTIQ